MEQNKNEISSASARKRAALFLAGAAFAGGMTIAAAESIPENGDPVEVDPIDQSTTSTPNTKPKPETTTTTEPETTTTTEPEVTTTTEPEVTTTTTRPPLPPQTTLVPPTPTTNPPKGPATETASAEITQDGDTYHVDYGVQDVY